MIRAAFLLLTLPAAAAAQGIPCQPGPDMLDHLARVYGEGVLAMGTAPGEVRVIVTVNPDTGSWTIVVLRPDGTACAPAAGHDWQMLPQGEPA